MRIEQIEKLLVEVGELLDLPQITAAEEEPSWHLLTRDGEVVHVDFEQETSRLYLSVGIGKARPEDYGLLLTYSSLWKKTLGLYCALEGTEGEAVLVFARVASYPVAALRGDHRGRGGPGSDLACLSGPLRRQRCRA